MKYLLPLLFPFALQAQDQMMIQGFPAEKMGYQKTDIKKELVEYALKYDKDWGYDATFIKLDEDRLLLVNAIVDPNLREVIFAILKDGQHVTYEIFLNENDEAWTKTNANGNIIEDKSEEFLRIMEGLEPKEKTFKIEKI